MSGNVLRVVAVLFLAGTVAVAGTPLPPYDFTGTWTGVIIAGSDVNFIAAELVPDGAKKFTGSANVEGIPCTIRGKRKKNSKVKIKLKCENRTKGKFKAILDIENDAMVGAGRLKQGRRKVSAQIALDRFVFIAPVCGNGTLEGDETCDDGNTADGDGCSATCTVEVAAELDEVEPNNDAAQATPVPVLPALVHGSVVPAFDEDFFRVEITGTELILETFDGDGPGSCSGTDTVIELRGPDGLQVVALDDDGGIGTCSRLVVSGLTPGVYYPCVRAFFTSIDAYQLLVDEP